MLINNKYEILNGDGRFVDFHGIKEETKDCHLIITLENGLEITCSEDHIFIVGNKNLHANSLAKNIGYLSTVSGDSTIINIEKVIGEVKLYDIIESNEGYQYLTNGIISHNCSFLGSGDNFIAEEFLRRIEEKEIRTPIRQEFLDKNFWIWEDYIPGEEYILSADASPGHGDDYSTINVLKINEIVEEQVVNKNGVSKKTKVKKQKAEQVAEYYGKVTPQTLAEISYQYGKGYGDALTIVDITGGYGIQTIEKLFDYGYPDESIHFTEVHHKPSRDRLHGYVKKGQKQMPDGSNIPVDLIPGFFIGQNRASVLLEMQRSIHLNDVIIRSIRLLNELKTFVNVSGNRVADHKRSFHDDSIMSLACGLYVLSFDMARFNHNKGATKKMLDAMLMVNDPQAMAERIALDEAKNTDKKREAIVPNKTQNPDLQKHISNAWLFQGLKSK